MIVKRMMMLMMVTTRMIPTPGLPSPQMLEPRFNSDTLAMLLNIPPQKTLLRRHLTTNFNSLVGTQAQQEKREYTDAAGYSPISITAKVKVARRGRERKGEEGSGVPGSQRRESFLIPGGTLSRQLALTSRRLKPARAE